MVDEAPRRPGHQIEDDYKHLSWVGFTLAIVVPTIYLVAIF